MSPANDELSIANGPDDLAKDKLFVCQVGILAFQVCTPKNWSEAKIEEEAEKANPCGATSGWHIITVPGDLRHIACKDCPDTRSHCVLGC